MINVDLLNRDDKSDLVVRGLTQFDYGQILQFNGIEIEDGTEIHFVQNRKVITQYIQSNQVLIPDFLLQYSDILTVYVYKISPDSGETILKITLPINSREPPGDYVTPEEPAYSRLIPLGGEEGQVLARGPDGYMWVDPTHGSVTEEMLQRVSEQIPVSMTVLEILEICK